MEIQIGNRKVGENQPVYIIAEACDNHLGNVGVAKEMIKQAKLAGADAVKFQHHIPDEEMLPNVPLSSNFNEPLYEFLKKYALTLDQHLELMDYCDNIGITYLCTPFSFVAALELKKGGKKIPAFKIGSGEFTDIPSLLKIAEIGKPLILSTGMSTIEEIDETVTALQNVGAKFALMNCVSEYPPVYQDINLKVINILMNKYPHLVIGHSDHTPDLYTSFAAVAVGARIIEKHFILNKLQPGPDQSVSIDTCELHELVDGIRKIEKSLGEVRKVHEKEIEIRRWAFRSVVSIVDIKAGETITSEKVWTKRPGTGIPSKYLNNVIGKKAKHDIPVNSLILWEDLN